MSRLALAMRQQRSLPIGELGLALPVALGTLAGKVMAREIRVACLAGGWFAGLLTVN